MGFRFLLWHAKQKKKKKHNKGVKAKQTNQFEAKVIFILCMNAIETLAKA